MLIHPRAGVLEHLGLSLEVEEEEEVHVRGWWWWRKMAPLRHPDHPAI